jgi:hypothetical protein
MEAELFEFLARMTSSRRLRASPVSVQSASSILTLKYTASLNLPGRVARRAEINGQ